MPIRIFLYLAEEYKRLLMRSECSSVAEYFDIFDLIKSEKIRCGSLETAVRHAILKYRTGYEISDFILNQKEEKLSCYINRPICLNIV